MALRAGAPSEIRSCSCDRYAACSAVASPNEGERRTLVKPWRTLQRQPMAPWSKHRRRLRRSGRAVGNLHDHDTQEAPPRTLPVGAPGPLAARQQRQARQGGARLQPERSRRSVKPRRWRLLHQAPAAEDEMLEDLLGRDPLDEVVAPMGQGGSGEFKRSSAGHWWAFRFKRKPSRWNCHNGRSLDARIRMLQARPEATLAPVPGLRLNHPNA